MSYPRYPEYKDSGVVWLGEVSAHWEMKRLGYFANLSGGGTIKSKFMCKIPQLEWAT